MEKNEFEEGGKRDDDDIARSTLNEMDELGMFSTRRHGCVVAKTTRKECRAPKL